MLVYFAYFTLICLVIFYLCFIAYIKFNFPFWSRMHMHHSYNILNAFSREGIIKTSPLEKSKWTNTNNINIIKQENITESQEKKLTAFIRRHKIMNKHTVNKLTRGSLSCYLNSHNKLCFVGIYYEKTYNNTIIGVVTSRPLLVRIKNKYFTTYFIENLFIHKDRKNEIDKMSPELIHSIIFKQQQFNSARTCLFERPGTLTIPTKTLLVYKTYLFTMEKWKSSKMLQLSYQLINVDVNNVHILNEIFDKFTSLFKCSIYPCWSNIINMIKHKRIIIYLLSCNGVILCAYFMRDPCIMHSDKNIIECISTVNFSSTPEIFIMGLNDILLSIKRDYKNIIMHDLSHSSPLIETIMKKHVPIDQDNNHLFLYNFIQSSMKNSDCIIIN